ncbi:MAG: cytochrome b/b6 domain-containing protein [Gammaproteobacteria bacterium]|nr:cytochrome b/b6 domain-containing protein [Gammaproteobacteria bacterium]
MTTKKTQEGGRLKAWDIGVRVFHWLLVCLLVNAWVTAEWGDMEMRWHKWNGYAICFLLVFRLLWGFFGSSTALFINFIYAPPQILNYARGLIAGKPIKYLGHNPLGALMVLLMLLLLLSQVVSGLFSSDGLFAYGPLSGYVSDSMSEDSALVHEIGFYLILLASIFHVGAIALYVFVLRDNLVKPMLTGMKIRQNFSGEIKESSASMGRLGFCVLLSACIVLLIISGFDVSQIPNVLFD